jgi:hypothetical protein
MAAKDTTGTIPTAEERLRAAEAWKDQGVATAKQLIELQLQAAEKATDVLADLYLQAAKTSRVQIVADLAKTQAELAKGLTRIYVTTTRELVEA